MVNFNEMKDGNTYKNLLNGKWVTSNSNNLIKVDAPHDNSYIGDIQSMTKNEVDLAFTGARTAFKTWKYCFLSGLTGDFIRPRYFRSYQGTEQYP